ncbi:DUF3299 domain-containing protein [Albimonas sp. CAU 1670]|uniref:DUF3299 domain-containing protein n=1 Tax=Albimonas sp. CAU 1670 TaxID=3032599 RepID=UPI0023DAD9AA|nr:DUF3299 domain-containing protein [Albimonas sp. CAU 1670]MDF2235113.1 DUF3299 domain-containing protein [Albimonas sp. CAU 1670]
MSDPDAFRPDRRAVVAGLALLAGLVAPLRLPAKEETIELTWDDLIPAGGEGQMFRTLRDLGVVQHGEMSTPPDQDLGAKVTRAFDGKLVRLPGFVVPLDYDGTGTTAFLLVPYVGACIHVPPPPPNQLVFVTTETPYEVEEMFAPVYVTGMFGAAAAQTQLADVGYTLSADRIEPYE